MQYVSCLWLGLDMIGMVGDIRRVERHQILTATAASIVPRTLCAKLCLFIRPSAVHLFGVLRISVQCITLSELGKIIFFFPPIFLLRCLIFHLLSCFIANLHIPHPQRDSSSRLLADFWLRTIIDPPASRHHFILDMRYRNFERLIDRTFACNNIARRTSQQAGSTNPNTALIREGSVATASSCPQLAAQQRFADNERPTSPQDPKFLE